MKIINRKEFLNIEPPVLYQKYSTIGNFGEMCIKTSGPKDGYSNDWIYQDLSGRIKGVDNTQDFIMTMMQAENGSEFMFDLDCSERDGFFDEEQLFAVYDAADLEQLISKLQSLIK